MDFGNNYKAPMDREFYISNDQNANYLNSGDRIEEPLIQPSDISPSIVEGRAGGGDFRQGMIRAMRSGARGAELFQSPEGEPGAGSEAYGKEKREDMKQLAKFNKFKVTVHPPPNIVPNLSGFDGKQGFSNEMQENVLNEIKKAVNFAADISSEESMPESGVPIVIHTGEYSRPISLAESPSDSGEIEIVDDTGIQRGPFEQFKDENKQIPIYMVDEKTGAMHQVLKTNEEISVPEWKTAKESFSYFDKRLNREVQVNQGDFLEINGRLALTPEERIAEFIDENGKTGDIKIRMMNLKQLDDERRKFINWMEKVIDLKKGSSISDERVKEHLKEFEKEYEKSKKEPSLLFIFKESRMGDVRQYEGMGRHYSDGLDKIKERIEKIDKALDEYKKFRDKVGEERFDNHFSELLRDPEFANLIPPDRKNVVELLEERKKQLERHYHIQSEAAMGYFQRAQQLKEQLERIKPVEQFGQKRTAEGLAEVGLYAYRKTVAKNLKKPIYIAPENVFPEMGYGSHPEELINIVKNARNELKDKLKQEYSMRDDEAEKIAKNHIKATLDTQHLGMWMRYFNPEGKKFKNEEERVKEFKEWYKKQIQKLAEEGVLGHVHLVDSFGRGHTHLPAGQGDMPVKETIEILKKNKVNFDIIAEGHEEGQKRQLTKVWEKFDVPIGIRGAGYKPATSWTNLEHSYFDKISGPNYIVGGYAPTQDWKFWSELPLE
ncbi:MAG TPA: hypothetical protein ENN46_00725 [Candidatus Woesearchaeota archaeon]|mgnify:CR=1 FL=1|nr:hypothetical protein [Candidatus Woesearchaeota archaeon]